MKIKYPYLIFMMNKRGEKRENLAELLNMSRDALNRRIRGEIDFTYTEAKILADHYAVQTDELMETSDME